MAVRIRLRRIGKKNHPCYRLAVVDSRVKRDGRFVEFVGFYDPMTSPHTIELKEERIIEWLKMGALYSDTVGSLLRQEGVLHRWHELRTGQKPAEEKEAQGEKKPDKAETVKKKIPAAAKDKDTAQAVEVEAAKKAEAAKEVKAAKEKAGKVEKAEAAKEVEALKEQAKAVKEAKGPKEEAKAVKETKQPEEEAKAVKEAKQPEEETKAVKEAKQPREEAKAVEKVEESKGAGENKKAEE
ncbi:MAG TPA: 30S ribosomal protein S16 [archaeon]|nr:30S ribosomal protein S16 [archaeon]